MKLFEIGSRSNIRATIKAVQALGISRTATINDDGSVNVTGDVIIPSTYTEIPVHFNVVSGSFSVRENSKLLTLEGLPITVKDNLDLSGIEHLKFLDLAHNVPREVGGRILLTRTSFNDLSNIHKTGFKHLRTPLLILPNKCVNIVGIKLCPGIEAIKVFVNNMYYEEIRMDTFSDAFEFQEFLLDRGMTKEANI